MPRREKLSDACVRRLPVAAKPYLVFDASITNFCIAVYPSGSKSWKVIYSFRSRTRWLHIAKFGAVHEREARKLAAQALLRLAMGKDPQSEKRAAVRAETFASLHERYLNEYAQHKNKSWQTSAQLIWRYVTPKLGALSAAAISRQAVKTVLAAIKSQSSRTQTLRSLSAIMTWAVKEDIIVANVCAKIDAVVGPARERILSDDEIGTFWRAFDAHGLVRSTALKCCLLLGQRKNEICLMRWEHIDANWVWTLPGQPVGNFWNGTKNAVTHTVAIPPPAQNLILEMAGEQRSSGYVFPSTRHGNAVGGLDNVMRQICRTLEIEEGVTPHDLRRTWASCCAGLCGTECMDRCLNHVKKSVSATYNRFQYGEANARAWETVAQHIMNIVAKEKGCQANRTTAGRS